MHYYQHQFDHVEDYLHHRKPYLLIEQICELDDQRIVTAATVQETQPHIRGHFPGAPILPGAMMQEMTTQTAGILIAARYNPMESFDTHDPFFNEYALGVLVQVKRARYRQFARPGDPLKITVQLESHLDHYFEFRGDISVGSRSIMQNRFQLANIPSKVLQGAPA
ncbi:MAG: hypothetical protein AAGF97_00715 [Planctomycetota bacterium]